MDVVAATLRYYCLLKLAGRASRNLSFCFLRLGMGASWGSSENTLLACFTIARTISRGGLKFSLLKMMLFLPYFPIQNLEKIESSKSSVLISPVISPRKASARRISMAMKSPVRRLSMPVRASRRLSEDFKSAS